ncbi:hypothetical protein TNCT_628071 [Trichonephila clavata]|uniref:Uncharacterized protein n=1 Tax=Trichonephila clavata TaxID=2740835 RepID=A0A8X6KI72_TRICU|nr:hypothetical protein TNCT_628071 [Trichonephila clavata]
MSPPSLTSPEGNAPTQQHTHPLLPGQLNNVNLLNKGGSSQKKKKGAFIKASFPIPGNIIPSPEYILTKLKKTKEYKMRDEKTSREKGQTVSSTM